MTPAWTMIPRYHPQIAARDVLSAGSSGPADLGEAMAGLGLGALREGQDLFALNGGTAAIYLALRALRLPAGAGVGVPVYSCVTVFEAVAAAGLRCVFLDVDPQTFGLDLDSLSRRAGNLAALIVIHTFGYPADMEAVGGIMGGRPIIEDCAHALGSSRGGLALGRRGLAGAFSFNYHKPVSAGGGGLLVVNDDHFADRVRAEYQSVAAPAAARRASLGRRALTAMAYRPPWYGLLAAAGVVKLRRDGALSAKVDATPMDPLDRALIAHQLPLAAARGARQRNWVGQVCCLTGQLAPAGKLLEAGKDWNGYLCPILLPTHARREAALDHFHARGVDAFELWPECLRTASRFGYLPGTCPRLEDALGRLLLLPCYAELTDAQKRRIAGAVEAWDWSMPPCR